MKNWQQVLRSKEVLALCAMAFMADICTGIITPTFSLYAKGLGASLTLIGALGGINGLTRIFSAVPVGLMSDSRGRKTVLSAGTLLFTLSSFLYTVVPNPYFLFPIRVLASVAVIATFFMGLAHLGDIVAEGERGLAIGLYTTCMGLGTFRGLFHRRLAGRNLWRVSNKLSNRRPVCSGGLPHCPPGSGWGITEARNCKQSV
jgi:MFS family permease